MTCSQKTYAETFPITETAGTEQLLANGILTGNTNFVWFQNNTSYDVNVLIFEDISYSKMPVELAVRSGGSQSFEGKSGSFMVWAAALNVANVAVLPAGYGGVYKGAGTISPTTQVITGYIQVIGYDKAVAIQTSEGNVQRAFTNITPLSQFTEPNQFIENNYIGKTSVNSSGSVLFTAQNTLEQIIKCHLYFWSPGQSEVVLSFSGNNGGAEQPNALGVNFYLLPGPNDFDVPLRGSTLLNNTPGIYKGTSLSIGSTTVPYYSLADPVCNYFIVTQVLQK